MIYSASATHCQKALTYHDDFGYGYDIYCTNLDDNNVHEMESVFVYNEVLISICNSNLTLRKVNIFKNLTKAKELIINNTIINNFREPIFEHLTLLETLTITNNSYVCVYKETLNGLKSVKNLNLSNNRLQLFEKGSLRHVVKLEIINLERNHITNVDDIPICEAQNLKEIHLNHNRIQYINGSSFQCLINLENLHLDSNGIKTIGDPFNIKFLNKLTLSDNNIRTIDGKFVNMINLRHLDLRRNKISEISSLNLCMLEDLLLGNNYITTMNSTILKNATNIKSFDLSKNRIKYLNVSILSNLNDIDLSFNNLTKISANLFDKLYYIKWIDVSNNDLTTIENYSFNSLQMLHELNLSHNHIYELTNSSLVGLRLLNTLDLHHNELNVINQEFLSPIYNLKNLNLAQNKLREFTVSTFYKTMYLESLNVSYNNLESLHSDVLKNLINLKYLDLQSNLLKRFDYRVILNYLPLLQNIDVNMNLFSCEFLTEMLTYLDRKYVTYTNNLTASYDKENVKGIYCKEIINNNNNNNNNNNYKNDALINQIYNITKSSKDMYQSKLDQTIIILLVSLLILFGVVGFVTYRIYLYIRRRDYLNDELELIEK